MEEKRYELETYFPRVCFFGAVVVVEHRLLCCGYDKHRFYVNENTRCVCLAVCAAQNGQLLLICENFRVMHIGSETFRNVFLWGLIKHNSRKNMWLLKIVAEIHNLN